MNTPVATTAGHTKDLVSLEIGKAASIINAIFVIAAHENLGELQDGDLVSLLNTASDVLDRADKLVLGGSA